LLGLGPARYKPQRAPAPTTLRAADTTGTIVVGRSAVPAADGGDVLTLRNGRRVLTKLHVAHLVAVIDGEQTVLGPGSRCQPGLYYGAPPSILPISSAAG